MLAAQTAVPPFTAPHGMRRWGVRVVGTGGHLPGPPITNGEVIDRFGIDTTDSWLRDNVGVVSRHWAPEGTATSDMAVAAAREALAAAAIGPGDLDRIILCSTTGDWTSPATACRVQERLGASCPAEDKQTACSSFLYGLEHGARLVATGLRHVLVIGADCKSRFVGRGDRALLPILADGARAVVLGTHTGGGGLLECELWSDGRYLTHMYTPAGGSACPASHDTVAAGLHTTRMLVPGRRIVEDAVAAMVGLGRQVCSQSGVDPGDVDVLIPHQANLRIMRRVAQALAIPDERVVVTTHDTGNIVSASVPFGLDRARREGRLRPGALVLMVVAGAGYSGGAALYEVPS